MSTINVTGFERRILDFAFDHGIEIRRGKVQRLANRLKCRLERMADLDKERLVMHPDPVPCEALHHILGRTPCKRCGQAPKELTA